MHKIAIIGSGIAGLGTAWLLANDYEITVFEASQRPGGHTNTVIHEGVPIDTGFIVFNDRNYPRFGAFLDALDVPSQASDMSFGVSIDQARIEWAGNNLGSLFGRKALVASAAHWRMLLDILRFNRQGKRVLAGLQPAATTLGDFLDRHHYSRAFRVRYLLPMAAAIWSAPTRDLLAFPLVSFLHFYDNHGLLDLRNRPQWRTVCGGSQRYVQVVAELLGPRLRVDCPVAKVTREPGSVHVRLHSGETDSFDQVVFACHADTTLNLLADADARERQLLGAFHFQSNRAVLHTDPQLMPRRRGVWSCWNHLADRAEVSGQRVSVTYWVNRLQGIEGAQNYFVSLNPLHQPAPESVIREIDYDHPVFDTAAIEAQRGLPRIQGSRRSWYCGAWCDHGFHEDGLAAAERVASGLGVTAPWSAVHA